VHDQQEHLRTALLDVRRRLATLERVTKGAFSDDDTLLQLLGAVETMQLGVTIADRSGLITYANPAQAAMYGADSPDELVGQDVSIFCLPGYRNPMSAEQLDELTSWRRESLNLCKDGTLIPVLLLSDVVRGPEGTPIGVVTTCEDLSDLKRAQTERNRLELQVRHSQSLENLGALTSGVARDLQEALKVIMGGTGLFLDDLPMDPEEVRRRIIEMDTAIYRLSTTASQLLTYSAQSLQGMLRVDLNNHLRGMLPLFEASAAREVHFRYEISDGLPLVQGDPTQIHHVVRQLIANASEAFQGQPGEIRVRTTARYMEAADLAACTVGADQRPGHYAVIEVGDNGPGMEPDIAARIFEPFFSTRSPSRGLGLTAAATIMQRHAGAIQLSTLEGAGTLFRLFFPVHSGAVDRHPQGHETVRPEELAPVETDAGLLPVVEGDPRHNGSGRRPRRHQPRRALTLPFGKTCPRCGSATERIRSPWHIKPLRLLLSRFSSTRACRSCVWKGFRLHLR
jgi:PAS domain S-box-containing protein